MKAHSQSQSQSQSVSLVCLLRTFRPLSLLMAPRNKLAPGSTPPAAAAAASHASPSASGAEDHHSPSHDDDDLQQFVVKPRPPAPAAASSPPAPTLKRKASPADEPTPDSPESSESQSEEEEEEDGEDEEEEEDLQAADRPKPPTTVHVPVPESQPSGSKKPTSCIKRVWSDDDEVVLLQTLSAYLAEHGKLPLAKECDAIVARIANSVNFSVTEKHVWNKIRTLKYNHDQRMMKHSKPNPTNPHQQFVFKMSDELFGGIPSKKNVSSKPKNDAPVATHDATTRTRGGGSGIDGDDKAKRYFYLGELMKTATGPYIPTLDFLVENIGDSKSHDLDTKAKKLWIDAIKLHSKEKRLCADLLNIVAIEMVGRKN